MAAPREELIARLRAAGDGPLEADAFEDVIQRLLLPGGNTRLDPVTARCFSDSSGVCLEVQGTIRAANGVELGEMHRIIHVEGRFASHEFLRIEENYKNYCLAPVMLLGSLGLYEELELEYIILQAGLETGRRYWASCGFDFVDDGVRQAVVAWCRILSAELGHPNVTDGLDRAYSLVAAGSPEGDDSAGIEVSLVELGAAIGRREHEIAAVGFDLENAKLEGWDPADIARRNRLAPDEQIPLGKALFLLLPCDWNGYLPIAGSNPQKTLFIEALTDKIEQRYG